MHKTLFLVIIFFYYSFSCFSQQVIIKGNAKSYAGSELSVSTFAEQITFTEQILAKTKVENNGDFIFKFNISNTKFAFIHLTVFKAIIYIEPNKEYEVVLPKKTEKLPGDKLNPFFKETEFYITILNEDTTALNYQIRKFDFLYNKYLEKYFTLFKGKLNKQTSDTIIEIIENELILKDNDFFNQYKNYNYASLKLISYERNKENFIDNYFKNEEILFDNNAYMNLFNQIFNNYLSVLYNKPKGKIIPYNLIREKSLKNLKNSLDSFPYLQNENLKEIVIVKSLYDNYYKDDFPKEDIIFMIDSIRISTENKNIKSISENILKKITALCTGYSAPEFYLPDIDNQFYANSNFRNKFIYLNFCTPDSYTCLQEFKLLEKLHNQKLEMFEIVTICIAENNEKFKAFVIENNFKWKFLFYNNDVELLKKYDIKAYPTYYLINPEGKFSMSPAFPPTESSFEDRYSDVLKAWKIELQKRKYNKGKDTNR
ncbi:MAG: TlpA family protein disulfide reductase [Bacteroidales bacterium]|nr:TlpA family protein disulfide reductase [Bacteroidales bacterium]MBN2757262.1 TlpA family protein disulfide reductase [Bacteroidales bacterium]